MARNRADLQRADHGRYRRALRWALPLVAAVHAVVLALLVVPGAREPDGRRSLFVVPMPEVGVERPRPEPARPGDAATVREETSRPLPRVATPVESPDAPESETIASTALRALEDPVQPLEVTEEGRLRSRAFAEPDARRTAIARAESIVHARLAAVGVEAYPTVGDGPVSLANGGVTLEIPWQGFVREDRKDEVWRRERCEDGKGGESDKAGEAEGRAGQCG